MPGFPSVLLRTLRDLRSAGIDAASFGAAAEEAADPTGKLSALASMYAEYERRRTGFFSSEDGLTVAEPEALGSDRLLVYGVWEPSALLLAALDTLLVEVGGHGVAAAGPSAGRGGGRSVRGLGGRPRRGAGSARRDAIARAAP